MSAGVISLSEPRQEGGASLENLLGADNISAIVENIRAISESLPAEEKELIYYRYYKNCAQTEVARIMGTTQVKVSRTEKRIMEKLRRELV